MFCRSTLRLLGFALLLPAAFVLLGCPKAELEQPSPTDRFGHANGDGQAALIEDPLPPIGPETPATLGPTKIYAVLMQMATVEAPLGIASGSEEIWSYLDEEPVARFSTVLGLNGVRIGLGRADAWKDLERAINRMTGQQYRSVNIQFLPGRPGQIRLREAQPVQKIFTFRDNFTVSGEDFPPGSNVLAMSCSLDPDRPDHVLVTVIPQIVTTRKVKRLQMEHGVPRLVEEPEVFNFLPLMFQVRVREGDFLVVGPGSQSRRPTSLAWHFLRSKRESMPTETVLIFRPTIAVKETQ